MKVPFKFGKIIFEKDIDFVFRIATLEYATNDILKCELWEVGDKDPTEVNIAIIYAAYVVSCWLKKKRVIYTIDHAKFWMSHLSEESKTQFIKSCIELTGKMGKGKEEKKKLHGMNSEPLPSVNSDGH